MATVTQHSVSASSITPPQTAPARIGDHERLFQLLEKVGPAPEAFMLDVSDPWIGQENIFETWDDEVDS